MGHYFSLKWATVVLFSYVLKYSDALLVSSTSSQHNFIASPSILNKRRVISSPYTQRAARRSVGEKLKEKMGHKLMFGSHFSYEYGQL